MRKFALMLFALSAWGQTTVTQTLTSPIGGGNWTGTITISAPSMTCSGVQYAAATTTLTITNGVVSVALRPNDACQVPTGLVNAYRVTYRPNLGSQYSRYWLVPTSVSAVSIASVEAGGPPLAQPLTILPQSLAAGSAVAGQVISFDGTRWAPATLAAGTGDLTGPAASVDSEVAVFNSTTGKALKRATQTGVAKLVSGVLSVVSGSSTDCVKVDGTSGACGDVTSPSVSVDSELALFSGTTGKAIKRASSSGVPKLTSGVLSVITGTASDCIKVDGSSGACGSGAGDVTGQSASVDSELALFSGTGGKTIKRASATGVAKLTSGVLDVVSGTASDCVKVDGSSGTCGANGVANYSQSFTSQTTVALTHNASTVNPLFVCYSNAIPPAVIVPHSVEATNANTLTITFLTAQSGTCAINSSGISGAAGANGSNGSNGSDGAAASVAVGTTTTGNPGTSASVSNSGSSSAAVLDFTIPRGAVGDTGPAGASAPNNWESDAFTSQTSVTLSHNLNATSAIVACKNSATPPVAVIPDTITFTDANTATVTFLVAQSGKCVVNVSGGAAGSGSSYTLPTASGSVLGGVKVGTGLAIDGAGVLSATGGGSMTYPSAGVPQSTGSAWGSSLTVGTLANNLIQLNGSAQLPAVSAALLTNFPTLNQSTSGNAATATALATARSIMGLSFDGTANIGSRSGNTTEFGTISGTKTVDKQLKFDASGDIVASSTDIGAGSGGSSSPTPIAFAGETTRTVTAATHGLGTTPVFLGCRRTSDGVWVSGVAYTTNTDGDVTINPAAGSAYTGSCYIGGPPSGALVLVDGNIVATKISSTASLSYSTFSGTGNCEEQSMTLAGAATGDVATAGHGSALPAGIIVGDVTVSSTNTVTIRLCRLAGAGTLSGVTFTAQIVRSF